MVQFLCEGPVVQFLCEGPVFGSCVKELLEGALGDE